MNIVLFTHPAFVGSQSHAHMARMFAESFRARGHTAEVRQPSARIRARVDRGPLAKWAGYLDQYVLFPLEIHRSLRVDPADTVYVFCDQALGPWIPRVTHRPHVVHTNDLLALRSALGLIPENPTGFTGRLYQRYIRAGFRHARHFISISEKTRDDLAIYGGVAPDISEVVYLGLNQHYHRMTADACASILHRDGLDVAWKGFLLHVGGGQWYKNTAGVIDLYSAYVTKRVAAGLAALPLLLVSRPPSPDVQRRLEAVPPAGQVRFVAGIGADTLVALYSSSAALLFPSLAEGWGWPIAEALACGCPVLTTGEAPMTEAGGPHAHYLRRRDGDAKSKDVWAADGAARLIAVLDRPEDEARQARDAGMAWALARYDPQRAVDRYLQIYQQVVEAAKAPRQGSGRALA